ncbi:antitoxin of toxin-antitoxin stability system [Bradyrhizobium septentrionale]|uniref:Antitoxin of toxin-antitoxin stability system n=1 Tax=Bradyrhizobium septentrionale TaxID=1404411 RepID=A0A973W3F9_9BRAD|nr:antitoxin of toxin-antitoxin stability system [Bradyrhizobium septentrionale]UGY15200.1 antitoxin of toxin-antitoxin stability system [Bradyrhizobium septentrionale]
MRTITVELFQFDELSDKAKEKARDWYRSASEGDNTFAEFVIEDAVTVAECFGIELDQRSYTTVGGKTRYEPKIWWRGFWSQGDGASFEGTFRSHEKGSAKQRIKAHAPKDEKLREIAATIDDLQRKYRKRLWAKITQRDNHYVHAYTMSLDAEAITAAGNVRDVSAEDEEALLTAMRDFANWIYRQLEKEYNHQNSDEQIDETIRANEYDFKGDGRRACA